MGSAAALVTLIAAVAVLLTGPSLLVTMLAIAFIVMAVIALAGGGD